MSVRDLKIKAGVVKRLAKELVSYEKEAVAQRSRIDKLISAGADEHDVNKQKEVLEETSQMIPDNKRRLGAAYKELETIVAELVAADPKLEETEEVVAAKTLLDEVTV
ncbi:hypothetical protein SeMB42_g00787 [Synchytrium endobioticum]|uniref:Tubulin-specific chaperone A n=1 Tax=Synchytrium endobioticum TaxID=286115 RepID=A0A507DPX2_9FUNG|nr:hypothetical protein SeLEV6574_g00290 [Synchytrium endobioticum]TPX53431.1 hypothetical protein SeMB42_g00787 [Synchytrium endobioticum]